MRRIYATLAIVALSLAASLSARADVFSDVIARGTIKIGVPADLIPFGYINANREPEGLDIDLANMAAKALGVKPELIPITGANRIPYLVTGKVDITIFSMGLTPERARQIMFSTPYASSTLAVWGPKKLAVSAIADLKDKKVVATKGNTEELALTALDPPTNIMRTENDAATIATYLSGQADLFAATRLMVLELQKRNPDREFEMKIVLRPSTAHMGVKMGELNMLHWLNSFIFSSKLNGTLDGLHRKWFGFSLDPLPTL